jgi:hypothetical protein
MIDLTYHSVIETDVQESEVLFTKGQKTTFINKDELSIDITLQRIHRLWRFHHTVALQFHHHAVEGGSGQLLPPGDLHAHF